MCRCNWIFKNKIAKANYDAFLSDDLDGLVFEDEATFNTLSQRLEEVIEQKNQLAVDLKLSEHYIYGNLDKGLIHLIKEHEDINILFNKASIYFPTLWQDDQAGEMIRSILRGALATYALLNPGNLSTQIYDVVDIESNKISVIRDIMNYFFALAVNKKQWFNEGSFMVYHDNTNNIFDLMESAGSGRPSSHFRKLGLNQYGLDVPGMPEGKTHLLFAEVAPNVLFAKPENFSL